MTMRIHLTNLPLTVDTGCAADAVTACHGKWSVAQGVLGVGGYEGHGRARRREMAERPCGLEVREVVLDVAAGF